MKKPTLDEVRTLEGVDLDKWTGIAAGIPEHRIRCVENATGRHCLYQPSGCDWEESYNPTEDWSDCGPLIERPSECALVHEDEQWSAIAKVGTEGFLQYGPTPQIAICRAVVAAWLETSE